MTKAYDVCTVTYKGYFDFPPLIWFSNVSECLKILSLTLGLKRTTMSDET